MKELNRHQYVWIHINQYWIHLHIKKRDYKIGTNDKTNDSHTHDYGFSRSDDSSVARNLVEENKNSEDDEYIDHPPIKNDRINSQSHENIIKILFLNRFH